MPAAKPWAGPLWCIHRATLGFIELADGNNEAAVGARIRRRRSATRLQPVLPDARASDAWGAAAVAVDMRAAAGGVDERERFDRPRARNVGSCRA